MRIEPDERVIGAFGWHLLGHVDSAFHWSGMQRLTVTDKRLIFKTLFFFEEFQLRKEDISRVIIPETGSIGPLANMAQIEYAENGVNHVYTFGARGSLEPLIALLEQAGIATKNMNRQDS